MRKLQLIALFFLISQSVFGKRFSSKYTEFELPSGWECVLEGSEYVCQSGNKDRQKEAIIILAAKKRGEQDSLTEYHKYLSATKTYTLPGGRTQVSDPKYTSKKSINSHNWVDSLHLASEVPGFYTRYLATVKEDLGVAVTFSVSKEHYDSYRPVFDRVVETLRVFRPRSKNMDMVLKKASDNLVDSVYVPPESASINISQPESSARSSSGSKKNEMIFYILIALAAGIFIFIKKRKKK